MGSPNPNNDHVYYPHPPANSVEASPLDVNQQTQQQQAYLHQHSGMAGATGASQPMTPASQAEASPQSAALAFHTPLPPTSNPDASPTPAFAPANSPHQFIQPGPIYQYQPMTPASIAEGSPPADVANHQIPCQQQPAAANYAETSLASGVSPQQMMQSPLHQQQMTSPSYAAASSPGVPLGNLSQQQMNVHPQQVGSPFSATPNHNGHHEIQCGKSFQILGIKVKKIA